jgi:NTP pyrophosphatase (non-canonical NTP hydrolase)/rRNA maturation protein Nop10
MSHYCPHCGEYVVFSHVCHLAPDAKHGQDAQAAKDAKSEHPSGTASSVTIAELMLVIERDNARWWRDLNTGKPIDRNIGELLMLMVSELSEAMEGHRKNLMDDKLPHRKMFEVELADLVIRVLDTAVHYAPALESAIIEKLAYNRIREDHKKENRRLPNGKKY